MTTKKQALLHCIPFSQSAEEMRKSAAADRNSWRTTLSSASLTRFRLEKLKHTKDKMQYVFVCFNFSGQNFFIWLRNSFIILVAIPRKSSRPKLPLFVDQIHYAPILREFSHTQIFLKRVCNRKYFPWKLNVICGNIVQIWLMMSSGIPKLHSKLHFNFHLFEAKPQTEKNHDPWKIVDIFVLL